MVVSRSCGCDPLAAERFGFACPECHHRLQGVAIKTGVCVRSADTGVQDQRELRLPVEAFHRVLGLMMAPPGGVGGGAARLRTARPPTVRTLPALVGCEKTTSVFEVHEQVQWISGGCNEFAVVFVEGPSVVVSRVNEQGLDAHFIGNPDSSTNSVDQESAAESSVPLGLVDSETSQEETRHLCWDATFGEAFRGLSLLDPRGCQGVVADNAGVPRCHEHPGVP